MGLGLTVTNEQAAIAVRVMLFKKSRGHYQIAINYFVN